MPNCRQTEPKKKKKKKTKRTKCVESAVKEMHNKSTLSFGAHTRTTWPIRTRFIRPMHVCDCWLLSQQWWYAWNTWYKIQGASDNSATTVKLMQIDRLPNGENVNGIFATYLLGKRNKLWRRYNRYIVSIQNFSISDDVTICWEREYRMPQYETIPVFQSNEGENEEEEEEFPSNVEYIQRIHWRRTHTVTHTALR